MEWQRARPGRLCTSRTRARVRAAAAVASPWTSCSPCSTSGRRAPPSGFAGADRSGGGAGGLAFAKGGGVSRAAPSPLVPGATRLVTAAACAPRAAAVAGEVARLPPQVPVPVPLHLPGLLLLLLPGLRRWRGRVRAGASGPSTVTGLEKETGPVTVQDRALVLRGAGGRREYGWNIFVRGSLSFILSPRPVARLAEAHPPPRRRSRRRRRRDARPQPSRPSPR
eukprot:gene23512-biopygen5829